MITQTSWCIKVSNLEKSGVPFLYLMLYLWLVIIMNSQWFKDKCFVGYIIKTVETFVRDKPNGT